MLLAATPVSGVLVWALILIVAVGVLIALIAWLRRRLVGDAPADNPPFTLHDLRTLHAQGRLSDEEFQRAKASMLASVSGTARGSDGDDSGPHALPQEPSPPFKPE